MYRVHRLGDRSGGAVLDAPPPRHSGMARRVQEWALTRGLGLFAAQGYRSQTVTTIENTLGLDYTQMNGFLREHDMRIANGYGPLKGKTFRIAHMGETTLEDIDGLLAVMDKFTG